MSESWTYVALGDSLTEGVGDPLPGGGLRGWADLLAGWLGDARPGMRYRNLARRGLTTAQVREQQLAAALDAKPAIASVVSGMNDVLQPAFDAEAFERELERIVVALRAAGADVVTSTFADVSHAMLLPARVKRAVARRLSDAGEAVRRVSGRTGAICVDCWDGPDVRDSRVLSIDRLHPGPWGHRLIAVRVAETMRDRLGIPLTVPDAAADGWVGAGALGQARWLVRNVPLSSVRDAALRMLQVGPR